jgi:hypothetical protein
MAQSKNSSSFYQGDYKRNQSNHGNWKCCWLVISSSQFIANSYTVQYFYLMWIFLQLETNQDHKKGANTN